MDKFIVSARKYRPQNFSTVVGQQHITTTLKNAINNNHLAHAFLFCGPRGVGKTTCARILAKTINCTNKTPEGEACNVCNSCISFDNGTSLNIHELDAASNNSVDDIRSLVEQVRFAPQAGDYKVYIIDEVHMLSSSAFNAFLKTLEEPPPYAIFILATTEKHKILPTILSRCQIFDFKRITTADTVAHLQEICEKEHINADETALHVISQKSEGCMRDSLSILDKIVSFTGGNITYSNTLEHLNILDEDYYFSMLDFLRTQKLSDALLLFDSINQKGFEGDTFMDGFLEFLRNLLVSTDPKAISLLDVAEGFKTKYLEHAQQVESSWMIAAMNIITQAAGSYKEARNKKLAIEMLLIKLSYLHQAIEISSTETGSVSKKKINDTGKPISFRALPAIRLSEIKSTKPVETPPHNPVPAGANLVIETAPAAKVAAQPKSQPVTASSPGTLASLKNIRKKLAEKNIAEQGPKDLTLAGIQEAIDQKLQDLQPTSKGVLQAAGYSILSNDVFRITVNGSMQQKAIESERTMLTDFLQQKFTNRLLKFEIEVVEPDDTDEGPVTQQLNKTEQFRLLSEAWPLVKELKERLRLRLD